MKRILSFGFLLAAACSSESPAASRPGADAAPDQGSDVESDVLPPDAGSDAATDAAQPGPCGPIGTSFTRCASNPLYTAGRQHPDGRYELFVADPSVLFDEEENKWKAWWQTPLSEDYLAPENATAILFAESDDGLLWTVQDEPVLSAKRDPADWDYDRLETPSVIKVPDNPPERRYVMFYCGGNFEAAQSPIPGYVWYQIGVAFSADGRSFHRLPASESPYAGQSTPYGNIEGLVLLGRDAFPGISGVFDGLAADPEVVFVDGTWHLFFSSMPVDASWAPLDFGISHATSTDGIHWTMSQGNPVWHGMQPSVVWDDTASRFELFFNGDSDEEKAAAPSTFNPSVRVSYATSNDGESFQGGTPALDWDDAIDYEEYGWLTGADAVLRPDGYWLFYTGFSSVDPPENFYVPANNDWCAGAGTTCTCYMESGEEICLLPTVVTLNLARKQR